MMKQDFLKKKKESKVNMIFKVRGFDGIYFWHHGLYTYKAGQY